MESWRSVWRNGVAPELTTRHLLSLQEALAKDDPHLIQRATTMPPPMMKCVLDWPVEEACLLGWCGWKGNGLNTVGEVQEFFAQLCFKADARMGEPAAIRYLLNWFDDTPRHEMRRLLLAEVRLALDGREDVDTPLAVG